MEGQFQGWGMVSRDPELGGGSVGAGLGLTEEDLLRPLGSGMRAGRLGQGSCRGTVRSSPRGMWRTSL